MSDVERARHRISLPVLGIETQFETNSDDVARVVDEAFGGWRLLEPRAGETKAPVVVRIVVTDAVGHGQAASPVQHRADGPRIFVESPDCAGVSDPDRREATARVSPRLVADGDAFRETVLEALTFALLSHFDRHPVHAAGVARNGRAILLAGPSGAGKSTLAYLAHKTGRLSVLNDDHVWIQREPASRVWGSPGRARVVRLGAGAERPHSGASISKSDKMIVGLDGARGDPACYAADRATLCLLERGASVALARVDDATLVEALTRRVDPGFDRFPERHAAVVAALAAGGGWRLTLSSDPRHALPFIETMLDGP